MWNCEAGEHKTGLQENTIHTQLLQIPTSNKNRKKERKNLTHLEQWLHLLHGQQKVGVLPALLQSILCVSDGPLVDGVWKRLVHPLLHILNSVGLGGAQQLQQLQHQPLDVVHRIFLGCQGGVHLPLHLRREQEFSHNCKRACPLYSDLIILFFTLFSLN